jgi:hypothetical protein
MPQAPQLNLSSGNAAEFQKLFAAYNAAKSDTSSQAFKDADQALRRKIAKLNLFDLERNEAQLMRVVGV